ncbi:MAG: hypothetical protein JXQ29_15735 [Planctomycetes bacterium]|nr:hypothetical protein [Planctomycetota bacterium]
MRIGMGTVGPPRLAGMVLLALVAACDRGEREGVSGRSVTDSAARREAPETAPPPVGSQEAELLAAGKAAWRGCAQCHCATDPRIAEDEDWVRLNEETTCIEAGEPAPRVRAAIMAYVRHPDTLRPILRRPDHKPADGEKAGRVVVPETGGSAYLKADRDSIRKGSPAMVRLYWSGAPEETSIAVPAGKYDVINFWFYRRGEDEAAQRWMVTGTNVNGCATVTVAPDEEQILLLEPVLYGKFAATRKDDRWALSFSMQDDGGSRMTLSRDGRVVIPRYRIEDAQGRTVAEGSFGVT